MPRMCVILCPFGIPIASCLFSEQLKLEDNPLQSKLWETFVQNYNGEFLVYIAAFFNGQPYSSTLFCNPPVSM